MVRPGSGRFGVFEILIHFDVLLFVLLFVLYTLVLFKVGIVDKNRFAHPQASCVVVPQGGGLCIHRREAAALRKKKKGQYKSDARCWSRQVLLSCFVSSSAFLFSLSLSNKFGFSHFSGCWLLGQRWPVSKPSDTAGRRGRYTDLSTNSSRGKKARNEA